MLHLNKGIKDINASKPQLYKDTEDYFFMNFSFDFLGADIRYILYIINIYLTI